MWHGLLMFVFLMTLGTLVVKRVSAVVWAIGYAIAWLFFFKYGNPGLFSTMLGFLVLVVSILFAVKPLRRYVLSRPIFHGLEDAMPYISKTEREALEAGTVGFEGDLFCGQPDFEALLQAKEVSLTQEEQAFLDGPTAELCRLLDDWDITHNRTDLSPKTWDFIKENGFLGMIIPKRYGGLEFSATAQLSVLVTLYGHSITAATTVSVPNSLGPAELLLKYGTEEQKNHYLPRLADGRDIPCFALTGPNAGSDAASIPDTGVVCRRVVDGNEVIGIRLNWNKRYITLCPVATVIGLAFRLLDPDDLLGKGHDLGISCALIPANTPGIVKGRRHFPLNTAFLNGPTQGKDVFVTLDCLIGGPDKAGHGWRMLMECLSAGRAIGLPASALGGVQAVALASGAYARIRKQFNQPIASFEGIEEPLARIAGNNYLVDSAVMMTAAAIDNGAKPSLAGAILKYHTTELSRKSLMDAMDIHGGKGICLGPNNYLGRGFQGSPISITVEGANILSRSLIIFGQGAIRCHPYAFQEIDSIKQGDLVAFDKAIWGHFGFILSNFLQSILFTITGARLIRVPSSSVKRYYQWIRYYSATLAFLADFSMITLGGKLKRREKLSARLGDVLSHLYFASAVLKRFHHSGEPSAERPLVDWCCQQLFYDCDVAIEGILANFPMRWVGRILRLLLQPFGLRQKKPSDALGAQLASILTKPSELRSQLTRFVFAEDVPCCPLGRLEKAFHTICAVSPLEKKIQRAVRDNTLTASTWVTQIEEAALVGIINEEEAHQLHEAESARQQVIAVDDFSSDELRRGDCGKE